ncbi:hypothetical protein K470DRAFT_261133 [Piedraia hortae CBS 480.64]|uniref:Uncharacterized protein n=1 Tax=Piedraia hortae CBS 480.64 TaxID=1314780 RepID=A0A6A7BQX7_9PEZI|nr:hypothetical protein K470DRAFT_261133 [Piedraia hortae CBS 480.64]
MVSSPRGSAGPDATSRPPLIKRNSSASSQGGATRHARTADIGDVLQLRQGTHVVAGGRTRHTLMRTHSSMRNLPKLGKQAPVNPSEARKNQRRSHAGDTEIRLPGSLEASKSPIKRNLTVSDLQRTFSKVKLKNNLSHGQLTKFNGSGRNAARRFSNGSKAKEKNPRGDAANPDHGGGLFHDQRKRKGKKVGFAIGSVEDAGDSVGAAAESSANDPPEDDWEDQSISPCSTRQNTANNSRRSSITADNIVSDKPPSPAKIVSQATITEQVEQVEPAGQIEQVRQVEQVKQSERVEQAEEVEQDGVDEQADRISTALAVADEDASSTLKQQHEDVELSNNSLTGALSNPVIKHIAGITHPAPALVSNISAMNSQLGSSVHSSSSSKTNMGGDKGTMEDELVSRFVPSTSQTSSGIIEGMRQSSYPEVTALNKAKSAAMYYGTAGTSPGSHLSGSSGAATPALGRSRIELRMLQDKALADLEEAAERQPSLPFHVFDRRNETLKSHKSQSALGGDISSARRCLSSVSFGAEMFQGRFKAINAELAMVEQFHNPIVDSVQRLRNSKFSRLGRTKSLANRQAEVMETSRSAIHLPGKSILTKEPRKAQPTTTNNSPVKASVIASPEEGSPTTKLHVPKPSLSTLGSLSKSMAADAATPTSETEGPCRNPRRGVSFSEVPPQVREINSQHVDDDCAAIARALWNIR